MSIPANYPKRRYADRLLRSKPGTTDDPDWTVLGIPPDVVVVTVAAVAVAGPYTVEVVPENTDDLAPAVVSATGVAADEDATAANIAVAVLQGIAAAPVAGVGNLSDYFDTATSVGPGAQLWVKATAPPFTISLVGSSGFTAVPDETLPTTAVSSNQRDYHTTQPGTTQLALAFVPVDGIGNPLPDDNGMLFTVEVVRYVDRIRRSDSSNANPRTPGVTAAVATPLHPVGTEYRIPWYGGRFGVRISSIATTPTGFAALEIYYREVAD